MTEDFTVLPDLASRDLGGSVVDASDELFAEKENLIKPAPPGFAPGDFGSRGKVYDGWETRRRREPGHDHAIVRLGRPGIVHGVVVDTSFFRGNYPAEISVEAACADGYPAPAELAGAGWHTLVGRSAVSGDSQNSYPVADRRRWTHLRLSIYPDGGVARLRVHGEVVPDPAFMTGTIDLAALENGGRVTGCSDAFYSPPEHLIMPGLARVTSDGWENARRRGPGNDFVEVRLAAPGVIRYVEIDTSCFVGNAPGWVILSAASSAGGGSDVSPPDVGPPDASSGAGPEWPPILPRTRVQPDTRHRFLIDSAPEADRVRLDVLPDGGLARLRVYGEVTPAAAESLRERWERTAPDGN
ncbi:MAG TPA: allantoicase [Streptosporangiaceae bacterium]